MIRIKPLFCAASAIWTAFAVSAGEYVLDRIYAEDRYESAVERPGRPTLVKDIITRGLVDVTGMGVYRGAGTVDMSLGRTQFPVAAGGKAAILHSIRVYGFGDKCAPAVMRTELRADRQFFRLDVESRGLERPLRCVYEGDGFAARAFEVALASLPVDFAFTLTDDGDFQVTATSLADSSRIEKKGKMRTLHGFYRCGERNDHGYPPYVIKTMLRPIGEGVAEVKVDDHFVAMASPAEKFDVPVLVSPEPEFDPVKAGWPLVFADEFDGTEVDWSKWYFSIKAGHPTRDEHVRVDGKGVLELEMNYGRRNTNELDAVSLRSKPMFRYGYYEARVKLSREPGWWGAFWMYGRVQSDPFVDGFEIDIFEDYYTRWKNPDGTNRFFLDHNIHLPLGSYVLKSWNYNSIFPGRSIDDWITVGCKWTPFEISYYLDGKLIPGSSSHSPWASVTFDAVHHFAGTAPLCLILSQQVHRSGPGADKSRSKFPEIFRVDYVRAYAMPRPEGRLPRIAWSGKTKAAAGTVRGFRPGARFGFDVEAQPARETGRKLKAVYLFDSGYMIGCKTEPPYVFHVEMTDEWYAKTAYMKPGRQGKIPDLTKTPHTFVAFVQDEAGEVSFTEDYIRRLPDIPAERLAVDAGARTNAIPGETRIRLPQNRWSFQTELVNLPFEAMRAGAYDAKLQYGLGAPGKFEVFLYVDGRYCGRFILENDSDDPKGCACDKWATLKGLNLAAGVHTVSVCFNCWVPVGALRFEPSQR